MISAFRPRPAALALLFTAGAWGTGAQAQTLPPPQNVLNLSAQATAEVPQDLLSITLSVTRDGADAAVVQSQLRQVLDTALAEARKAVKPGQLDVRSGGFSIYPRYLPRGGVAGWQGSAELVLEGRDIAAISQLAPKVPGMTVARMGFGLSREAREKAEAEVAGQAIARFKARAELYARQFGFGNYSLREVTVGQSDPPPMLAMARAKVMAGPGAGDEGLPVEAGKATVTVSVNGAVQMSAR